MLTFKILDNGNLSVTADLPGEIQEMIDDGKDYWQIMSDLFEETACNGSYTVFDGSVGNPYVGLTDATCVAESLDVDDEGNKTIDGDGFWYWVSVTELETKLLAKGETIEYQWFQQTTDKGKAND